MVVVLDIVIESVVESYVRSWRIENGISEAIKFFNINNLSSPILVKVHFDATMTMSADTLYSMLAWRLRGFESCDAQKSYCHFLRGKNNVAVDGRDITIIYPHGERTTRFFIVPPGVGCRATYPTYQARVSFCGFSKVYYLLYFSDSESSAKIGEK